MAFRKQQQQKTRAHKGRGKMATTIPARKAELGKSYMRVGVICVRVRL